MNADAASEAETQDNAVGPPPASIDELLPDTNVAQAVFMSARKHKQASKQASKQAPTK
jgi:hypothetical protein